MSSTSYMNAGKHLIQQKIDEIRHLKEEIQKDIALLANDEIQEGAFLLQTNDKKLFRSKNKQMNQILDTVLMKLLSISSSIHREGSCCSDSDTSLDDSELNVTSLKCNESVTLDTVINTPEANGNKSVAKSDTKVVTSSPIPYIVIGGSHFHNKSESSPVEETTAVAASNSQQVSLGLSNGRVTNKADDDGGIQKDQSLVDHSSPVAKIQIDYTLKEESDFPPGYDSDFKIIMSKLSELKMKVPYLTSSEDVAVRDLLAQQVNDFFGQKTNVETSEYDSRGVLINESSNDTIVVESDILQNVESIRFNTEVEGLALEEEKEQTMTEASHRDIDGLEVKVGSVIVGCITHVESPSLFYVRPLDVDTQEILIDNLNQHYDSCYREQVTEKPFLGMCCCALEIEKNTWSRAVVTEIHESEPSNMEVSVFYVDYGHTEKVSLVRLKKLDEAFRHIPRQAVLCCLLDVEPLEERTEYKEEEIQYFRELVRGSNVKITFHGLGPVRSVDVTQLLEEDDNDDGGTLNVSEILLGAGIVSYRGQIQLPTLKIPTEKVIKEFVPIEDMLAATAADVQLDIPSRVESGSGDRIRFNVSPTMNQLGKSLPVFNNDDDDDTSNDTAVTVLVNKIDDKSKQKRDMAKETKHVDLLGRFDIPLMKLNAKKFDILEGMTEIVNSPSDFYIHFANKDVSNIDNLSKEINGCISDMEAPLLILDPVRIAIGSYWCCRSSEDGRYYRAKILDVVVEDSSSSASPVAAGSSDDEASDKKKKKRRKKQKRVSSILPKVTVLVFYIDYGNVEWVGTDALRMISTKFCKLPALAVKCRMAQVTPIHATEGWSREATELLRSWVDNKNVKIQIFIDVDTVQPDVSIPVYLWDLADNEGKIFNEELVQHGFASSDVFLVDTSSSPITSNGHDEISNLEAWDPMGEDFKSARNSYAVDIDDAGVALTGYKARDEQDICMFYQRNKRCPRGIGCRFKHIRPSLNGITTDVKMISHIKECIKLPPLDQFVVVKVTALEHPGKFFVRFPLTSEPLAKLTEIPDWTPPSENIYILDKELQKEYNRTRSKRHGSYLIPAMGEIVVAKYTENNYWYRARVTDFNPSTNEATVYFVDYGNEEIVSEDDIREIDPRFLHLPIQAVECALDGIQPLNGELQWCEQSRSTFERLLPTTGDSFQESDKDISNLTIKVKDIIEGKLYVQLYNMSSKSNVIINDALVNAGVACYGS